MEWSPQASPCMYGPLVHDRGACQVLGAGGHVMQLEKNDFYLEKDGIGFLSHSHKQKNQLQNCRGLNVKIKN